MIIDSGNFHWDPVRYPDMVPYIPYGKFSFLAKLRNGIWRNMGGCMAPVNAYLNLIGLETLGLRMERICNSALQLAEILNAEEGITVNYPLLSGNPYRELCERQFHGYGGGIFTLRLGSKERAFRWINALKYASIATNIGDIRTLVVHPASTIYLHSSAEQRKAAGVYDDTVRVSVGIEDPEDLIQDFRQAFRNKEIKYGREIKTGYF